MICNVCGAQNDDNAVVCSTCGQSFTNQQQFNGMPNGQQPYGQQPYGQQPYGQPMQGGFGYGMPNANIEKRDIVKAVIFTIITLGIYGIYWFVKLTDDSNTLSGDPNQTPGITAFLLTLVTCGIYGIYWSYKKGEIIDRYMASKGMQGSNNAVLYLVLSIVGLSIVVYVLLQSELNKAADGQ